MYAALVKYSVLISAIKRVQLVRECWITIGNGPCFVRDMLLALPDRSGVVGSELVFKFAFVSTLVFLDRLLYRCHTTQQSLSPCTSHTS